MTARRFTTRGKRSPERGSERPARLSHITPGHVRAFQMVTSGAYDNVSLWSCRINGAPGVVIALIDHAGEGKVAIMPLFAAITPDMRISFDDEEEGDGGGGGPRRPPREATLREFEANKVVLMPGGGS